MMRWVLVVDDDAVIEEALTHVLQELCPGVNVIGASKFSDAKRLLLEFQIDVVITDYRLSKRTGIDLAMWASRLPVRPRFILMTAYPDASVLRAVGKQGIIEGLLSKPFHVAEAMELLNMMLSGAIGDPKRRHLRHMVETATARAASLPRGARPSIRSAV